MLLGQFPGSASTQIQVNWCPQAIHFTTDTVPSSIKVEVLGYGVICDLDGPGIAAITRANRVGNLADQYIIPLATGNVNKMTTVITVDNASVDPFSMYGFGEGYANAYVKTTTQLILQNSGQIISNFSELCIPDLRSGSDRLTYSFLGGFTQDMESNDVRIIASYSTYTDDSDSDYRIVNWNKRIVKVNYIPSANTNVYKIEYLPLKKS